MRHQALLMIAALVLGAAAPAGHPQFMHQPPIRFDLSEDSVVVPMKQLDGRIILDVTLNGKGPYPFIFD